MEGAAMALRRARHLPPPFNDLAPILFVVALYATLRPTIAGRWQEWVTQYSEWPRLLFVCGCFAVYMAVYWGYSLVFLVAERIAHNFLLRFKIQPKQPYTSLADVIRIAPLVLANQVFLTPVLLCVFVRLMEYRIGEPLSSFVQAEPPSRTVFAGCFIVHLLCVEAWFYPIHRMLHSRLLYNRVHKIHHEYSAPCVIEAAYVHPAEFLVQTFPVLLVGCLVAGSHLFTCWAWLATTTFLQVHDHVGHWLPFVPKALMHDYHHQKSNCCYGIIGLLDALANTEGDFQDYLKAADNEGDAGGSKED